MHPFRFHFLPPQYIAILLLAILTAGQCQTKTTLMVRSGKRELGHAGVPGAKRVKKEVDIKASSSFQQDRHEGMPPLEVDHDLNPPSFQEDTKRVAGEPIKLPKDLLNFIEEAGDDTPAAGMESFPYFNKLVKDLVGENIRTTKKGTPQHDKCNECIKHLHEVIKKVSKNADSKKALVSFLENDTWLFDMAQCDNPNLCEKAATRLGEIIDKVLDFSSGQQSFVKKIWDALHEAIKKAKTTKPKHKPKQALHKLLVRIAAATSDNREGTISLEEQRKLFVVNEQRQGNYERLLVALVRNKNQEKELKQTIDYLTALGLDTLKGRLLSAIEKEMDLCGRRCINLDKTYQKNSAENFLHLLKIWREESLEKEQEFKKALELVIKVKLKDIPLQKKVFQTLQDLANDTPEPMKKILCNSLMDLGGFEGGRPCDAIPLEALPAYISALLQYGKIPNESCQECIAKKLEELQDKRKASGEDMEDIKEICMRLFDPDKVYSSSKNGA